jgi:hypothetical protein
VTPFTRFVNKHLCWRAKGSQGALEHPRHPHASSPAQGNNIPSLLCWRQGPHSVTVELVWGGWPVTIRDLPPFTAMYWFAWSFGFARAARRPTCLQRPLLRPHIRHGTLWGPSHQESATSLTTTTQPRFQRSRRHVVVGFYSRVTHLTGSVFDLARRKAPEHTTSWLATGGEG